MDFNKRLIATDNWLQQPHVPKAGVSESKLALTYLRVSLMRVRPGMADFLIRASTPKSDNLTNKIVNVRASKENANTEGYQKIAKAMVSRFKEGDTTHDWDSVDTVRLGDMLSAEIKFFVANTNTEQMEFVTEAL